MPWNSYAITGRSAGQWAMRDAMGTRTAYGLGAGFAYAPREHNGAKRGQPEPRGMHGNTKGMQGNCLGENDIEGFATG